MGCRRWPFLDGGLAQRGDEGAHLEVSELKVEAMADHVLAVSRYSPDRLRMVALLAFFFDAPLCTMVVE